jgi:L-rhamnonate dehydratase
MFYGRKGLPIAVISVIDIALWDLVGKIRNEPVLKMIGGSAHAAVSFYCTGCNPRAAKSLGFWGVKVPLPYGPNEGHEGLRKNVDYLRQHREAVGSEYSLMVDCWMSLTVPYAIDLINATKELRINWFEEMLHPDDVEGYDQIKRAAPSIRLTAGKHEYTRYGFRRLIESRNIDILQPDILWVGGLTELLRIAAHASVYDIPVVLQSSGPYSYHFTATQVNASFQEFLSISPDSATTPPTFGNLFLDEPIPVNGLMNLAVLNKPGFGLTRNPAIELISADSIFQKHQQPSLTRTYQPARPPPPNPSMTTATAPVASSSNQQRRSNTTSVPRRR